jgi:hypothetical protein
MPNVFVSYNRESMVAAETLANDIRALGHVVWFDQELTGGQAWWNQILASVRSCDVFVFVLTPESLSSAACTSEYGYAAALSRPILPILIADGVSTNLLPPALSRIQFVDCRIQNRSSALRLARALATVAPPGPLPDPLPEPPEVPVSYLGGLAEHIETRSILSYEQQSALVVDLKRGLRDPQTFEDARALLDRLRMRRDLLAAIRDEIDELPKSVTKASSAAPVAAAMRTTRVQQLDERSSDATVDRTPERQELQRTDSGAGTAHDAQPTLGHRVESAAIGAVVGAVVGVGALIYDEVVPTVSDHSYWTLIWALASAAGGGVAGAISGRRIQLVALAIVGAAVAYIWFATFFATTAKEMHAQGVIFGASPGAILGALAGRIFVWWRARPKPASRSLGA